MKLVIHDDLFPAELVAEVLAAWPPADWPGWVSYAETAHCKRASNLTTPIAPSIGVVLARMAALPVCDWFAMPVVPDLSLHGSGLHQLTDTGQLGRHRDADTHRRLGLERVLSGCLWLSNGGALVFESGLRVEPRPGRLCVFDCRDEWHWVDGSPDLRRSLAMFWYAAAAGPGRRLSAEFVALSGPA